MRSGPGAVTFEPLKSTSPESGLSRPASSEMSVDFPAPEKPTMTTTSPASMSRLTRSRTWVEPWLLLTSRSERMGIVVSSPGSGGAQAFLGQSHQAIEAEADEADGEDAQDDVLIDEGVVFLPKEAADAGGAGEHLGGDDHE